MPDEIEMGQAKILAVDDERFEAPRAANSAGKSIWRLCSSSSPCHGEEVLTVLAEELIFQPLLDLSMPVMEWSTLCPCSRNAEQSGAER